MKGVLVTLHVSFPGENFIANITRKLAPLALMYFRDVNAEVFLISEIFIANPAHKLFRWRVRAGFVLLRAGERWQQQLGNFGWGTFRQDGGGASLGGLRHSRQGLGEHFVDC